MIRKVFIRIIVIGSLLGAFGLSHISVSQVNAQACASPVTPLGVNVDYPNCSGGSCDLTRASCGWALQGDAASYNVTVTEVETGTIIKNNENQTGTTSTVNFPITQLRTYKCDVVAVAACGSLSLVASDQLLCDADAIIGTPTPTNAVVPTVVPEIPNKPTLPPTGGLLQTVGILGGITLVFVVGIMLFVL